MARPRQGVVCSFRFSALQRAEIAEIRATADSQENVTYVSVLFNEPKLPKSCFSSNHPQHLLGFSALQRAEIAEICAN